MAMDERVQVFVCYMKAASEQQASTLCQILNEDPERKYTAWVDEDELQAGMEWEAEIYQQIAKSQVLVVLVGAGTSHSDWVKREILIARSQGITVVPVGHGLSQPDFVDELKKLGLDHVQGTVSNNIRLRHGPALLAELNSAMMAAYRRTRETQLRLFGGAWEGSRPPRAKAQDNLRVKSYRIGPDRLDVTLSVTAGDIARVRNIDVLVNSENNFMQMARFFESTTVSSILRHRGARKVNGHYDDAIQHELDMRLEGKRPVQVSEVVATSAGGPDSLLARENKARVILHVAAVEAVISQRRLVPFKQPDQIIDCVHARAR